MSHVDEGALHAYLDGALDDYPAEEAARIRAHLEECAACTARLEEARELRVAASAILADADPGPIELPSLEELRREARAGQGQRRLSRLQRMAWAASVVVALGAGWMVRGQLPVARDMTSTTPTASTPVSESASEPILPAAAEAVPEQTVPEETEEGGPPGGAGEAEAPVVAERSTEAALEADVAAGAPAAPVGRGTAGAGLAAEEERVGRRVEELARRRDEAPARAVQTSAMERAPLERLRSVEEAVDKVALDFEMEDEPSALSVPGLSVLSVSRLELQGGSAVRILQLLESADTLEILHLPAGTDPSELAPAGADERELVVPREGGWLVLRGRLGDDRLREILARLEGG